MSEERSKYGNRRAEEDGYTFASQAEWRRYRNLKLMRAAGQIEGLEVHPVFPLVVDGVQIGRYTGDFRYHDVHTELAVVEDVKPAEKRARSRDYVLRKKLMLALYGIEIQEVES